MIKSLTILALIILLAGGAFLSKPKEADFKPFIEQKLEAANSSNGSIGKLAADLEADAYVKDCTFKDRMLWTTVQKDNKSVYVGAFSHWFNTAPKTQKTADTTSSHKKKKHA
jgi:hypothetical protein